MAAPIEPASTWSFGPDVPGRIDPSPPTRLPGELLARFQVQGELGRGGAGVVLRALDPAGREVALKLLEGPTSPERAQRVLQRFRREGELTAALRHPGIVPVHEAGEAGGVPYLVYGLIQGGSLSDRLRAGPLPPRELARIVRDAAAALGHAHAHGVVHRDVKPSNILLEPGPGQERVVVADFGLAWFQGAERLTEDGGVTGTPFYMAPEQLTSSGGTPGPPCDVWALGVILYEGLTGRRPFEGRTITELAMQVLRAGIDPPTRLAPEVPAGLEEICLRALARDPRRRQADGTALAAELGAWLRGERPRRGPGRPLLLLAAALLPLLAAGLLSWSAGGSDGELRRLAEQVRRGALPPAALDEALRRTEDASPPVRLEAARVLAGALDALGQPAAAAEAWARVCEGEGTTTEDLLAWGEARLACDDAAGAAEVASRALVAAGPGPLRLPGLELAARAALRGDPARVPAALAALLGAPPSPGQAALLAALGAAAGEDPGPTLGVLAAAHPGRVEPALELAASRLAALDPCGARRALEAARRRLPQDPQLAELEELARELAREPLGPVLPATPVGLAARRALGAWLLWRGELEAALARRPDKAAVKGAAARELRAREALQRAAELLDGALVRPAAARALAGLAGLAGPQEATELLRRALTRDPREPRALLLLGERRLAGGDAAGALEAAGRIAAATGPAPLLRAAASLRGRALLALGRPQEALVALERAATPEPDDLLTAAALAGALEAAGRREEAGAWAPRLERMAAPRPVEAAAAAEKVWSRMRSVGPVGLDSIDEAVALDPWGPAPRRARIELTIAQAPLVAVRDAQWVLRRHSLELCRLTEDLWKSARVGRSLVELAAELPLDPQLDELARALLLASAVEVEGRHDLSAAAEQALERLCRAEPGVTALWALRGFLALRAGRLEEADLALRIAGEADPGSPALPFYRALLLGVRRAAPTAVMAELRRAQALDYRVWGNPTWTRAAYPELELYMGAPGFDEVVPRK